MSRVVGLPDPRQPISKSDMVTLERALRNNWPTPGAVGQESRTPGRVARWTCTACECPSQRWRSKTGRAQRRYRLYWGMPLWG